MLVAVGQARELVIKRQPLDLGLDDVVGADSGAAYVYVRHGSSWTLEQQILSNDLAAGGEWAAAIAALDVALAEWVNRDSPGCLTALDTEPEPVPAPEPEAEADDAEGLALLEFEGQPVHCPDDTVIGGEVDLEVVDAKEGAHQLSFTLGSMKP